MIDDAREGLSMLLRNAWEHGASEVHLSLPVRPGFPGGASMRVGGILTDLDPSVVEALSAGGDHVADEIYSQAIAEHSDRSPHRSMQGRISAANAAEWGLPMPDGMSGVDVVMIPGQVGTTYVFLRPRAAHGVVLDRVHASWDAAVQGLANMAGRPSRGVTLFISPESETAAAMMQAAADMIEASDIARIMAFDSLPWRSSRNVVAADIEPGAVREAAARALGMGCDIAVLGGLPPSAAAEATRDLLALGGHVWIRARGSVSEPAGDIARRIGLPDGAVAAAARAVRVARMSEGEGEGEPVSDPHARDWLARYRYSGTSGCLQRKQNAPFPEHDCLGDLHEGTETEDGIQSLARLAAGLVDRGQLCAVDASRKLS